LKIQAALRGLVQLVEVFGRKVLQVYGKAFDFLRLLGYTLPQIVYGLVGAPILEEIVKAFLSVWIGPWPTAVLFGIGDLVQFQGTVATYLPLLVKQTLAHRLFMWLRERWGFAAAVGAHSLHNHLAFAVQAKGAEVMHSQYQASGSKESFATWVAKSVEAASKTSATVPAHLGVPLGTSALLRAAGRPFVPPTPSPWVDHLRHWEGRTEVRQATEGFPIGEADGRLLTPLDCVSRAVGLPDPLPSVPHSAVPTGVLAGPVDPDLTLDLFPVLGTHYDPPVVRDPWGRPLDVPEPGFIEVNLAHPQRTPLRLYYAQGTDAPLQVPAATEANLVAAMILRAMKPSPMRPVLQAEAWRFSRELDADGRDWIDRLLNLPYHNWGPIDDLEVVPQWKEHLLDMDARKRNRALKAYSQVENSLPQWSDKPFGSITTHAKTDERLCQVEVMETSPGSFLAFPRLKPRLIQGPNEVASAALGPVDYEAGIRLKASAPLVEVNPPVGVTVLDGEQLPLYYSYASGATQRTLSLWGTHAVATHGVHVLTAGDDVYVNVTSRLGSFDVEGDLSMCDQSLSYATLQDPDMVARTYGPLADATEAYRRVGAPDWSNKAALQLCAAPLVVQAKHGDSLFVINRSQHPSEPTGITRTTGNNTVAVGLAVVRIWSARPLEREGLKEQLEAHSAELGLDFKWVIGTDQLDRTMLKGWWSAAYDGSRVWTKLPGQFVKLGSSRRPFESLVDGVHWMNVPKEKRERLAAAAFLRAQAKAELAFHRHPLYDIWAKKVLAQTSDSTVPIELEAEPWKVTGSLEGSPPVPEELIAQTARRYGVAEGEVQGLLALIASSPLFCWLQHPLLLRLAFTDYA